ncbi:MAG: hypothetical protein ACREXR_00255 [Gammaproteobacteria bacterium]
MRKQLPGSSKSTHFGVATQNPKQLRLLSEPDFNVDHAFSWAKIAAGLFQQNRPEADIRSSTERIVHLVMQ